MIMIAISAINIVPLSGKHFKARLPLKCKIYDCLQNADLYVNCLSKVDKTCYLILWSYKNEEGTETDAGLTNSDAHIYTAGPGMYLKARKEASDIFFLSFFLSLFFFPWAFSIDPG